jgi:ribosome biogenesis GTPase
VELGTQPAPIVGDFVAVEGEGEAGIRWVLPRRSVFARKRPGLPAAQPLAANLDLLVVVTDPGGDFSIRRVERYVETLRAGCDAPVLLAINKADTADDAADRAEEARTAIPGLDAVAISARTGAGLAELAERWKPSDTVVLAGSSGVGKSTLVNALCEAGAETGDLREDGRGKHKTTTRRAYVAHDGALLIDTPGLREVGLYYNDGPGAGAESGGGSAGAFADIEALAEQCKFRNCRHESEPGCAVRAAVEAGELEAGRYESYLTLRSESEVSVAAYRERKRRWEKEIAQEIRRMKSPKRKP